MDILKKRMGKKRSAEKGNEKFHFQVNLGGMLDVLSNHLYKSPDVFLRELLQNGVDAITLRKKRHPEWSDGRITITLEAGKRMKLRDNGEGLTEEEIHRFLAVIGQSSKRELENGQIPQDFIGRFGIGLLSCFMVSDSIVVQTQSARGGQAHRWVGRSDGTYTLEALETTMTGTAVILHAKPGREHYFQPEKVTELVRYYGLALPVPVYLQGNPNRLNEILPEFVGIGRSRLLAFGSWIFGEEFLDAVPIQTPHLSGVAYVLNYRTDGALKRGHRIYLKQMLLTEKGDTLLPPWAFFLRCFLNTNNLRAVASREDFYEDEELEFARKEFEEAVESYLKQLAQKEPERLQKLVNIHAQAIKALAVWDEELFGLFIDYLPFETSEGTMTGATLKQAKEAAWVGDVFKFKQLKPVFMAQGRLLICTGYTYDTELIRKLSHVFAPSIVPLQEEGMELLLEEPEIGEALQMDALIQTANAALEEFDCQIMVKKFFPAGLPALYVLSDEVQFFRQVQSAREAKQGIFSDALSALLESVEQRPMGMLYFNLNNSLICRLANISNEGLLESIVRVLYIQALLAGGHPLQGGELKTMNAELLKLIDYSI